MERIRYRPRSLVLRRFENEAIELLPADRQLAAVEDSAGGTCRIAANTDGGVPIYHVLLPDSLAIRPVDWRRFAYDHVKVSELLSLCVRDNLIPLSVEAWSEELRQCIETTLTLALGDLNSVFDLKSVRCESGEDVGVVIKIEGEHKNGQLMNYSFAFDLASL